MGPQVSEKKGYFYGWTIVLVATLALAVSNGLTTLGIAVFSRSVRDEFVAGGVVPFNGAESMIATASFLTFLLAGFFSPVTGYLIKRFSLRRLMISGCFILGFALLLHSQAQTPLVVYIARILMGASLGFVGVMPQVVLVSNWFRRRRGTSLGIVLTGTSLGGFAVPLIATPLLVNYGWRTAMLATSLLVWLILLPAIFFLVKDRPAEKGQYTDGDPLPDDDIETDGQKGSGFTLRRALGTPVFWIFALCAAALFYTIFVVTQQFILYLQTPKIGFSPSAAGYFLSILSAVSMGGKFLFGWLSDRLPPPRVMLLCCGVMFASTFIFFGLNAGNAIFFILIFAISYGGTFVLLQLLVAEFFGRREYGKILGVIVMIETIGAAIGGKITGYLADADGGDYTRAFYGVIVSTGLAFVLTLMLNRKRIYLTF